MFVTASGETLHYIYTDRVGIEHARARYYFTKSWDEAEEGQND